MRALSQADTIAAISTSLSPSAVSMIRISGKDAYAVADAVFSSKSKKPLSSLKGYSAAFGKVFDTDGEFDSAVALCFKSPKSYTGEDVVEITVHGGSYLAKRLLRAVLNNGARLADAGEFTRRAFENGKLTLTEAESVAALISANGKEQAKAALMVSEGRLNEISEQIAQDIVSLLGKISAYCDYPDEDIVDVSHETLLSTLNDIKQKLAALVDGFDKGSVISEGVDTVIIGSPNVGKSTIMNLLSGFEKSIVTDIAGTTRDIIEDKVSVGDFVLKLSDTAGIRKTSDTVEAKGVERAVSRIENAALIIAVFDGSKQTSEQDLEIMRLVKDKNAIAVINKQDLEMLADKELILKNFKNTVLLSAIDREQSQKLCDAICSALECYKLDDNQLVLVTERQRDCAGRALAEIENAINETLTGAEPDMVGITVEGALSALYELSGKSVTEAVVNEIFSKFCVGK